MSTIAALLHEYRQLAFFESVTVPGVVDALVTLAEETVKRHPEEHYPGCFWCALLKNLHAALEKQP